MIRQVEKQEEPAFLQVVRQWPVTGALLEMHWHITVANPLVGHVFYWLDEQAVLKLSGHRATLCGIPQNPAELAGFLRFCGVDQLTSLDWVPPGWQPLEKNITMVRQPGPAVQIEGRQLPEVDLLPSVEEVLQVLECVDGRMSPEDVREGFYADFNIRRNHKALAVYGVRQASRLVSTAGAYAITPHEVYIACVETRPEAQHKGYATGLLNLLCTHFGNCRLTLFCNEPLTGFYRPFGFLPTTHYGYVSQAPE